MNQAISFKADNLQSAASPIHLNDYLVVLKRRLWVIIVVLFAVVSMALLLSYFTPNIYEAKVQIIIEEHANYLNNLADTASNESRDRDYYLTQYNLLRSRALAQSVIDRLSLWKEFGYTTHHEEHNKSLAVDKYLQRLTISPIQSSRLVNISFQSPSASSAARIANAHALSFIDQNIKAQHTVAKKALEWLKKQLQEQKDRVSESQQKIHQYNRTQDIVSMESSRNIIQQKLLELNSALTEIRSKRIAKEQLFKQLELFSVEKEDLFSISEIAQDPIIQNLRKDLIVFKTKRLEMATKFGPKHPKMLQLKSSIQQINSAIGTEVKRVCQSIKANLDRTLAIESIISRSLEQQKMETLAISEKMIKYDLLKHEIESNRQLYDILLKQAKEISLTGSMENNSIRIIDHAETPLTPVRPKPYLNIFVGILLGIFFGVCMALFAEYMDNTITTTEQIEKLIGLPALGSIPYNKHTSPGSALIDHEVNHESKNIVVYKTSEIPDLSGRLANLLHLPFQDKMGQVLVVESAARGEGKSTVVANLAVDFAKAGLRVAMLDCDVRSPSLHAAFGMEKTNGLTESIERVLFQKSSKGSLNEFSMDDLFFLAMLRRFSGLLYVSNSPHSSFHDLMIDLKKQHGWFDLTNDTQVMKICFSKGRAIQIEDQGSAYSARLGRVLLKGGFINKNQLADALKRTKRTGLPFGYILINAGYITKDALQGPMKLQMEENLHKLFSWKQGSFSFQKQKSWLQDSDRVYFDTDLSSIIRPLGELTGSIFIRDNILSCLLTVFKPNLFLVNPGHMSTKLQGPLNSIILSKFSQILKQYFDVVIVDSPPLLEAAESVSMAAFADAAIMVIQSGKLSVKKIREAKQYLDESKCKTVWGLLNQAKRINQR